MKVDRLTMMKTSKKSKAVIFIHFCLLQPDLQTNSEKTFRIDANKPNGFLQQKKTFISCRLKITFLHRYMYQCLLQPGRLTNGQKIKIGQILINQKNLHKQNQSSNLNYRKKIDVLRYNQIMFLCLRNWQNNFYQMEYPE